MLHGFNCNILHPWNDYKPEMINLYVPHKIGLPVSPLLFAISTELLAIKLQSQAHFKGLLLRP